jgi:hypothetical protein
MNLEALSDEQLIQTYPRLLAELKKRGIIRTNNLIGELGEFLAVNAYNSNPSLPKLQLQTASTKNIDATSSKGERYAIKSVSGNATGVFSSLSTESDERMFEYLVIVKFKNDYSLEAIHEISWAQFLEFRRMKRPEGKWNIPLTRELLIAAKKIM